jgi:hypothetical protein
MITFVRLTSYAEASGHFNVLLRNQLDGCSTAGIAFRLEDLSPYPHENQLEVLLSKVALTKTKHVYFEWLHDIPNIGELDTKLHSIGLTWSVTASISELWNSNQKDSRVFKMLNQLNDCKALGMVFVFDDLLVKKLNFKNIHFTAIPQFENLELDSIKRPCCSLPNSSKKTIGVVGQLYGYRGVNNLISIVSKNRGLRIFLWGQERWQSVNPFKRFVLTFLIGKKQKFILDKHLTSDAELNHAFIHIDALYIDGTNYPSPSGIAVRARNFGLPVLVEDGESYLKAKSLMDSGIVVERFRGMSEKRIIKAIEIGKALNFQEYVSKVDQQKAFLKVWSDAIA